MRKVSGEDQALANLDDATKRSYNVLHQFLEQGQVSTRLVIQLKERDRLDNGYLNDQMIIQAFNDTFAEIKRDTGMPRPNDQEIRTLLRPLNKNTAGFHNYRELLMHIFGHDKGDRFFLMDR